MILRFGFAAERSWYFDMADGELFNLLCGSLICSIGWTGPPPPSRKPSTPVQALTSPRTKEAVTSIVTGIEGPLVQEPQSHARAGGFEIN